MPTQYNRLDDNGLLYLLTLLEPLVEENVIEEVRVNGTALTVNNKSVNVTVPTNANIQSIVEAYGYQTAQDVDDAIADALEDITGLAFETVQSLPQTGETGKIYLVPTTAAGQNAYDEYIWLAGNPGSYEKLGTADLDLSGYVQSSEMHALTNAEIDTIFQQVFGS